MAVDQTTIGMEAIGAATTAMDGSIAADTLPATNKASNTTKKSLPQHHRPETTFVEDESLCSPARNPVFAIRTITISKPGNDSGEITDETASRTTRTEGEDDDEESEYEDDLRMERSSSHHKT